MGGKHGLAVVWRSLFDIGIFSLIINALLLVMPVYLLQVYDRVIPAASYDTLLFVSIIAVCALVFLGVLEVIRSFYAQRVAGSFDKNLGGAAFRASMLGPGVMVGDIQPLRDLAAIRTFIGSKGLMTLFDLPFAPLFLVLLAFIHPALFWLTLAGVLIMIAIVVLNQIANGRTMAKAAEQSAKANLAAQTFIRNAETLRAMGMEENATKVWGKAFASSLDVYDRSSSINATFSGISRSTRILLQLGILGVGAWLVLEGEMTAGMIFASSIVSGRALQPLDQLIAGWRQTSEARRSWKRLSKVLDLPRQQARLTLPDPKGRLEVRNLVYIAPGSPAGSDPIIRRVSFAIEAGESVAITGPSRAGKSTLARLLVGAIQANAGQIELDGADLQTWDRDQLGRSIGYLAQDVQLLPGTIAENICRLDDDATDKAIVEAADRAQVHDLILGQREGYQTQIGPSSANLSGGERQRIGLARAFYGSPKLLVLDEPNANLDRDGEAALMKALEQAQTRGTTVVIVTHRRSIAAACDRVMVLRNGTIESFGRSNDVLKKIAAPDTKAPVTKLVQMPEQGRPGSFGMSSQGSARWAGALKTDRVE